MNDETLRLRIAAFRERFGRQPTLPDLYHRDFTGTYEFRKNASGELEVIPRTRSPRGGKVIPPTSSS